MTVAHAGDADELLKQRVFQHEKCANVCQAAFDKELFQCMPYRLDKERAVSDDCALVAKERFDKCMQSCPVDPRIK